MINRIDIQAMYDRLNADPSQRNAELVNFMLRDTDEIIAAGLNDLVWCMDKYGCCKNDVIGVLEMLEEWRNKNNK